jgi:hypothetical protein
LNKKKLKKETEKFNELKKKINEIKKLKSQTQNKNLVKEEKKINNMKIDTYETRKLRLEQLRMNKKGKENTKKLKPTAMTKSKKSQAFNQNNLLDKIFQN